MVTKDEHNLEFDDDSQKETEEDIGLKSYDITSSPNDFNISTICNLIDENVVQIPVFQRNYVWDKMRASKLIESIIIGLPIPQIFLYEKDKNQFLVIDGQQRLLSIYFFIKQRFPTPLGRQKIRELVIGKNETLNNLMENDEYFTDFKLSLPLLEEGQKNSLNKLTIETLGEKKHTFMFLRTIRCIMIKQNSPNDESSMFEIFNRLNTGGYNLKPQEIRMCLAYTPLYEHILEMNLDPRWRKLVGSETPDVHFKDIEIILRSLAMYELSDSYTSPMNAFLITYSKKTKTYTVDHYTTLMNLFSWFLDRCSDLDKDSFRSANSKFSISLFESVFVSLCKRKESYTSYLTNNQLLDLKMDTEYIEATTSGIASRANVLKRIACAERVLK